MKFLQKETKGYKKDLPSDITIEVTYDASKNIFVTSDAEVQETIVLAFFLVVA